MGWLIHDLYQARALAGSACHVGSAFDAAEDAMEQALARTTLESLVRGLSQTPQPAMAGE